MIKQVMNKIKQEIKYLPIFIFAIFQLAIIIISGVFDTHINNSYLLSIVSLLGVSLVALSLIKVNLIVKILYSLIALGLIVLYELWQLPEMPWALLNTAVLSVTSVSLAFVLIYPFMRFIKLPRRK